MPQSPLNVTIYLGDQNPGRDRSMGITRMTTCLAGELIASGEVELTQIISRSSFRIEGLSKPSRILPWNSDHKIGRLAADQFHPFFCRGLEGSDLWYYPKGYLPRFPQSKSPNVITIHDTILQWYADRYPHYRSRADYTYWLTMMKRSIGCADRILTDSKASETHIRKLADRFNIRHREIDVTYLASDFETQTPLAENEKEDFALHLASSAPHKKTNHLLRWWKNLAQDGLELPMLKLAGAVDAEAQEIIESCPEIQRLDHLDEETFIHTLKRARVLIIPSEIEGFGLPALEAYFCGTPACYVAETSVDEIVSRATRLGRFSLDDRDSFQGALEEVLHMKHESVIKIGDLLRREYSVHRFGETVLGSLRAAV
ncbi:MAG: glycosyltransferase [Verrucomicrobiales bacterium]